MKITLPWMAVVVLTTLISLSQRGLGQPIRTIGDTSACSTTTNCSMRDVASVVFASNRVSPDTILSGFEADILDRPFAMPSEDISDRQIFSAEGLMWNLDSKAPLVSQSGELNDGVTRLPDKICVKNCPPPQVPEPGSALFTASVLGGIAIRLRFGGLRVFTPRE